MDSMLIQNVQRFSQKDNVIKPFVTCFPTSLAMIINYILTQNKKKPSDIGINSGQIEDYLTNFNISLERKGWLIKAVGTWTKSYNPWVVALSEEKTFNDLMSPLGYKATYMENLSFDQYCSLMERTNLPQISFGNYKEKTKDRIVNGKKSPVEGHITCTIGFDKKDKVLIVHDPFGSAHNNYIDDKGESQRYKWDEVFADKKGNGRILHIYKV